MLTLDLPTIILISVNLMEMVTILYMLLPFIDVVILSKNIKILSDTIKTNSHALCSVIICGFLVVSYGIIIPMKSLHDSKTLKLSKSFETPEDQLIRIITATDASRNFILGAFSLFYLLVILRLFDFVTFSAKLHEFSQLMANYELIDVTLNNETEPEPEEPTYIIEEFLDEEETVHWPSIIDFNKIEHSIIRNFFRSTPKKTANKNSPQKDQANDKKESTNKVSVKTSQDSKTSNAQTSKNIPKND